jgi:putative chitinase
MSNLPSPCGINASLDEAKAQIDALKEKIAGGLNSIGDLGAIADTIKAKLSEVNIPQVPNVNLQAELASLPYLTPDEYNAKVAELKRVFGSSVDNLDEIIGKIPKPIGLSSSSTSLYEQLQNLAANITTTTQDILNSLTPESIAASITDLCKEVPNVEVDIVLDEAGNPKTDDNGNVVVTPPVEKPAPPVTPQKNPTKEVKPADPPVAGFTFAFTKEKFVAAAGASAAAWYDAAAQMLPKYGITTPERVAGWIGQIRVETGFSSDPKKLEENLNYSAKGLASVFKKYFKTLEDALPFEKKPEKIANKVYASRYLNGDEASGDGYRYRGRGLKQLTFKANYLSCSKDLYGDDRLVKTPDVVATDKTVAIETSLWFWKRNNLSGFADKQDYRGLSIKVNGGENGLADRLKFTEQALNVLKA